MKHTFVRALRSGDGVGYGVQFRILGKGVSLSVFPGSPSYSERYGSIKVWRPLWWLRIMPLGWWGNP